MKELTYILGAGASYQSIPVVKTFPERFNRFVIELRELGVEYENKKHISPGSADAASMLLNAASKSQLLYEEIKSHQSFDTYFKKLFHTGKLDEIVLGKKILHLYFIWEHLVGVVDEPNNSQKFWKQSMIDKRYDAMIAGLLKPVKDKCELYCNTNFITWNYDMNLLCSLKNYFFPMLSFKEFIGKITDSENNNIWRINEQLIVINMNGYFYSNYFNERQSLKAANYKAIFFEMLCDKHTDYFHSNLEDKDAGLIKFAWEQSQIEENRILNITMNKIKVSENVVVIGYTFPLYNRLVDLTYFNENSLYGKTLSIQDPEGNEIEKKIIEDFSLQTSKRSNYVTFNPITNCDNFFVPNNIFKIKN